MRRRIDKLSVTLNRILKARGLEGSLSEYRILGQWEKAVGAVIARHAQPQSLHGKKLVLVVDSPAWMQQLSLLKPEIIEKINRGLGREAIRGITLKLGEVVSSSKLESDEAPLACAKLDPEECTQIETYLQELRDPEIREALRRLMGKDFLSRKEKSKTS